MSTKGQKKWNTDELNDETFVWQSPDCKPGFFSWQLENADGESEPNNRGGRENCVEMSPSYNGLDFTPHWNDSPCERMAYCMCSREAGTDVATSMSYSYSYSFSMDF